MFFVPINSLIMIEAEHFIYLCIERDGTSSTDTESRIWDKVGCPYVQARYIFYNVFISARR